MPTTPDNTSTTWRDLADKLTPWQIAALETWEQRQPDEHTGRLIEAISHCEENLNDARIFEHVDAPEGAEHVYHAQRRADGTWYREFTGTDRRVAGVYLSIEGEQSADGSVKRTLCVSVDDRPSSRGGELSFEEVRQLVGALSEAADELDGWVAL
jgi:hypothetical protein